MRAASYGRGGLEWLVSTTAVGSYRAARILAGEASLEFLIDEHLPHGFEE